MNPSSSTVTIDHHNSRGLSPNPLEFKPQRDVGQRQSINSSNMNGSTVHSGFPHRQLDSNNNNNDPFADELGRAFFEEEEEDGEVRVSMNHLLNH